MVVLCSGYVYKVHKMKTIFQNAGKLVTSVILWGFSAIGVLMMMFFAWPFCLAYITVKKNEGMSEGMFLIFMIGVLITQLLWVGFITSRPG